MIKDEKIKERYVRVHAHLAKIYNVPSSCIGFIRGMHGQGADLADVTTQVYYHFLKYKRAIEQYRTPNCEAKYKYWSDFFEFIRRVTPADFQTITKHHSEFYLGVE